MGRGGSLVVGLFLAQAVFDVVVDEEVQFLGREIVVLRHPTGFNCHLSLGLLRLGAAVSAPRLLVPGVLARVNIIPLSPAKIFDGLVLVTMRTLPGGDFAAFGVLNYSMRFGQHNRHGDSPIRV